MKKEDKDMLIMLGIMGAFILAGGAIFGVTAAIATKSAAKTVCAFGVGTIFSTLSLVAGLTKD